MRRQEKKSKKEKIKIFFRAHDGRLDLAATLREIQPVTCTRLGASSNHTVDKVEEQAKGDQSTKDHCNQWKVGVQGARDLSGGR